MRQTGEDSRVEATLSGELPVTTQCERTYREMLTFSNAPSSFFLDLNCEGNSHTEVVTNTTWVTDGNLLKLEDGFKIGID